MAIHCDAKVFNYIRGFKTWSTEVIRYRQKVRFLNRIITGDVSWVHHYTPESKRSSMHRVTYSDEISKFSHLQNRCVLRDSLALILVHFTRTWPRYVRVFAVTIPSVCLTSVCLSVICNVGAPYSEGWTSRQKFFTAVYAGHPLTSVQNFTEIVLGEPLRRER